MTGKVCKAIITLFLMHHHYMTILPQKIIPHRFASVTEPPRQQDSNQSLIDSLPRCLKLMSANLPAAAAAGMFSSDSSISRWRQESVSQSRRGPEEPLSRIRGHRLTALKVAHD